ncbi:hypothetical protein Tco_0699037 [Tanacetum coccineum]
MNNTTQQTTLENALVAPGDRVNIGKCNMRIIPTMTKKEPAYQVVLDALVLSPLYPAFLITAKVPEIYIFPNQEFVKPPSSDEEITSFIKELGYKGDIASVTEVITGHMHQPWRTFAAIINRCLSGKTISLDKIRLSRAQILWGIFHNKNVDYVELLWEDFMFQIDNRNTSGEYQAYGALIPVEMTNLKMQNSPAYKTYLAFATRAATPKKARKFKKHASPSKKKTLVALEESAKKPAKKPAARRQLSGSSDEKVYKKKQTETNIHQVGGSSEGYGLESEVPDESKGKSIDTISDDDDDDQQGDDERTKSDDDKSVDLNKTDDEEETQEYEFVHTPENYVAINDETNDVDDEEYRKINEEMYDDVNVELKDTELEGEGKDDEEIIDAGHVDAEHENVNQEVASDQVKDVAHTTVTAALAAQETKVPLQSSSISFYYAAKFINFDNILLADTEIISMMEIKDQHEDPSSQSSPRLNVPNLVILESSTAPATTIPPPIPSFIPLPQQSTPIPTPTTTEATISTTSALDS